MERSVWIYSENVVDAELIEPSSVRLLSKTLPRAMTLGFKTRENALEGIAKIKSEVEKYKKLVSDFKEKRRAYCICACHDSPLFVSSS